MLLLFNKYLMLQLKGVVVAYLITTSTASDADRFVENVTVVAPVAAVVAVAVVAAAEQSKAQP